MILDRIDNFKRYLGADFKIDAALRFASGLSDGSPDGRYELSDGFFFNVMTLTPKDAGRERKFETHKKYLDLQLILQGEERVSFSYADRLTLTEPYSEEKDAAFYVGRGDDFIVRKGEFYLVFPTDAHAPGGKADTETLKKAVIKIPYKEETV